MTYRDEHEALRARLEATEQRLRETERELAEAKRRLEGGPEAILPSTAPPPSLRVGFPEPEPSRSLRSVARVLAGVGGVVQTLVGLAFLLWNLPTVDRLLDIATMVGAAAMFFLLPGGILIHLSLRPVARVSAKPARRLEEVQVRVTDDDEAADADANANANAREYEHEHEHEHERAR